MAYVSLMPKLQKDRGAREDLLHFAGVSSQSSLSSKQRCNVGKAKDTSKAIGESKSVGWITAPLPTIRRILKISKKALLHQG